MKVKIKKISAIAGLMMISGNVLAVSDVLRFVGHGPISAAMGGPRLPLMWVQRA